MPLGLGNREAPILLILGADGKGEMKTGNFQTFEAILGATFPVM
jgi:hypothetical protein